MVIDPASRGYLPLALTDIPGRVLTRRYRVEKSIKMI